MKFSAPDWCFWKDEYKPEEYYPRVKECGYDAVEMVPGDRHTFVREAGLEILNMGAPGMAEGLCDTANHGLLLDEIPKAMAKTKALGVPHLILFSGNGEEKDWEQGRDNCAVAIEKLAPQAESLGITLIFEMLNTFDHVGYQAGNSAYGFDIARRIGSNNVKVLYDIYHMHRMGEDVIADISQNVDIIAHLHTAGAPVRDFPGDNQEIDYAAIVAAARTAGYDGYWGHEFVPKGDSLKELAEAAELFRSY
jgi:hydroxypyruvate isomerase